MNLSEKIPGCKHFIWREALWLPEEKRAVSEAELTEELRSNLINTFQWMDKVREWIGRPITVTIALRTMKYHLELYERINIKRRDQGLPELKVPMGSMHLKGRAVDFVVSGMSCDEVKKRLLDENKLEEFKLRLEDNGNGAGWVHLDDRTPGASGRFFKP